MNIVPALVKGGRLVPLHHSEGQVQFLLNAEEKILQWISARAPVPEILNEISTALNFQIGNIVSFIFQPEDDVTSTAEIARNAALFGLHVFSSAGIVAESGDELGSLEIYCHAPLKPSSHQLHLIERAACLAGIAIERNIQKGQKTNWRIPEEGPVRGTSRKWSVAVK
jgi:hypothetical protein